MSKRRCALRQGCVLDGLCIRRQRDTTKWEGSRHLVKLDQRDFETERKRLSATIDRFVAGGQAACTTHPHPFFGRLTPQECAIHMYKHFDHHLRQFGA